MNHECSRGNNRGSIRREGVRQAVAFLEVLEAPDFKAGVAVFPGSGEEGVFNMPGWIYTKPVRAFVEGLYAHGLIIPFDWPSWRYGRELARDPQRIARCTAHTCIKLLTAHVRQDRFFDGHLAGAMENGQVAAILRRLKVLLERNERTKNTREKR